MLITQIKLHSNGHNAFQHASMICLQFVVMLAHFGTIWCHFVYILKEIYETSGNVDFARHQHHHLRRRRRRGVVVVVVVVVVAVVVIIIITIIIIIILIIIIALSMISNEPF